MFSVQANHLTAMPKQGGYLAFEDCNDYIIKISFESRMTMCMCNKGMIIVTLMHRTYVYGVSMK